MRTTVSIDDHLLRQARELAARRRQTLGDVVDDALRVLMTRAEPRRDSVDLPVFGGSGVRAGVDLEDKEALAARLGEEGPPRAAG